MRRLTVVLAIATLFAAGACSSDDDSSTLTVFAAASLTESFVTLGETFESEHPGVTVNFSFAGSADLVTQIENGAPADVFASANPENMAKLTEQRLIAGEPTHFATNVLQIAVPVGNPARIEEFSDLAGEGLRLVVCAPEVPCGAATQRVSATTGVELSPVSEESAVTDVLNKVRTGEADAGLVYVTDVVSAGGEVEGIAFPEAQEAVNVYPIGKIARSESADLAGEFIDLVLSAEGQAVLGEIGFGSP